MQRNVGGVEPDDAVVALVDVAVPAHRRRQDQIAVMHVAAAAVDDGGGALGARRKADRREGVPVRPRPVAGIEHGEGRDQVGGRHRLAAERRIDQDQRAPLDIVDRHFGRPRAAVNGSMSFQRQISGGSLACGLTGVSVRKRSHSGCRFAASSLRDEVGALASPRLPRRPWRLPQVFGSFSSMLVLSMMTCLMNTRGSTLSPLRYCASTSTPSRPHSTGLSSMVIASLPSLTARSAGGTPFMPVTSVLLVGGQHRLHRAERDVVVGGVDRLEVRIGDQRVLGLLDAALAGQRAVALRHDLDFRMLRHHLGVAVAEIAERRRAGRAEQHRHLALAADLLGGPFGDVAADLLLVHRHMQRLVRRGRAARHRDDRHVAGLGGVIGGVHADRVDRRNQDALDAARHQVLHAVDLLDLVLVGRDGRDLPAELLRPRADAAQHGDVERIVVLRERDADGDFLLRRGGRRQPARPAAAAPRPRAHDEASAWQTSRVHDRERSRSAAAAAMITAPIATRCQ